MRKKMLALLAALTVLALAGCQGSTQTNDAESTVTNSLTQIPETTESPVPTVTSTPMPESPAAPETPAVSVAPAGGAFTASGIPIDQAEEGDIVIFGSYEQDNDFSNGSEQIEWIVLEKKDGKLFLLSKYALEAKAYNDGEKSVAVTWEMCTLRSWLNDEFYNSVFTAAEQSAIAVTHVENADNPYSGAAGGKDTDDRIFLLSLDEALTYFSSDRYEADPARSVQVTEYLMAQGRGSSLERDYGFGWWWLRSPGSSRGAALQVNTTGVIIEGGVYDTGGVVRPALWLNLDPAAPAETPAPTPTPTPPPAAVTLSGQVKALNKAKAGDNVVFGSYEQDNNLSNGSEPIEWIVLEKRDGKLFLLSKYALDFQWYHEEFAFDIRWDTCTLRSWLNSEFYNTAFTAAEKNAIAVTHVETPDNPQYWTDGGKATDDRIFLLSIEEVMAYFGQWNSASCAWATEYAKEQVIQAAHAVTPGVEKWMWAQEAAPGLQYYQEYDQYYGTCGWLLRSPGFAGSSVAEVTSVGYVYRSGDVINGQNVQPLVWSLVRPVLWLDLESVDGVTAAPQASALYRPDIPEITPTLATNGTLYKQGSTGYSFYGVSYPILSEFNRDGLNPENESFLSKGSDNLELAMAIAKANITLGKLLYFNPADPRIFLLDATDQRLYTLGFSILREPEKGQYTIWHSIYNDETSDGGEILRDTIRFMLGAAITSTPLEVEEALWEDAFGDYEQFTEDTWVTIGDCQIQFQGIDYGASAVLYGIRPLDQ